MCRLDVYSWKQTGGGLNGLSNWPLSSITFSHLFIKTVAVHNSCTKKAELLMKGRQIINIMKTSFCQKTTKMGLRTIASFIEVSCCIHSRHEFSALCGKTAALCLCVLVGQPFDWLLFGFYPEVRAFHRLWWVFNDESCLKVSESESVSLQRGSLCCFFHRGHTFILEVSYISATKRGAGSRLHPMGQTATKTMYNMSDFGAFTDQTDSMSSSGMAPFINL